MSDTVLYISLGAAGTLAIMLMAWMAYGAVASRRKRHFEPPSHSRNGARLVSKARYRGRRVYHYSDGEVIAETRRGYKPFESFDDYRYHVDRR